MRLAMFSSFMVSLSVTFSAYATSGWHDFSSSASPETVCNQNQVCQIDRLAFSRAVQLCQKDSAPDYCLALAEYGWNSTKSVAEAANQAVTYKTASNFTVLCGLKENQARPC